MKVKRILGLFFIIERRAVAEVRGSRSSARNALVDKLSIADIEKSKTETNGDRSLQSPQSACARLASGRALLKRRTSRWLGKAPGPMEILKGRACVTSKE